MDLRPINQKQKAQYNKLVTHLMQSWEWGEFREKLGVPVLRYGLFRNGKLRTAFQLTIHHIPFTNYNVGYLPKGPKPDKELADALAHIGKENNCAFIKIEPNITVDSGPASTAKRGEQWTVDSSFRKSTKPLFTKYNFVLDLIPSEEQLLKNMHPKTRYNIKVAEKHGVKVEERSDDKAFEIYLKLYFETSRRQNYHGHNKTYHQKVWQTLKDVEQARLLIASYQGKPLTAWMLLSFKDTLYYPYGGSSKLHPEVMSNNLVAWETIKLGKKLGLKKFDMWGALGPEADPKDPWMGFHRFKAGFGGKLVEYIGTFDLVFNWPVYFVFTCIDKLMPLKIFLLKWISH